MANATGRPTALLMLSSDEGDYLERQVRRHRVARSMSERCRIILRCTDGLPSKVVAAELGVHEHTVGKWRRRFLKDRIEDLLDEARPGRPAWPLIPIRLASGVGTSPSTELKAFGMSPGPARPAPWRMLGSRQ
jgi:hypothetical protein